MLRKKSFFQKKWSLIQEGVPLNRAMGLVKQKNTKSYQIIEKLLNDTRKGKLKGKDIK